MNGIRLIGLEGSDETIWAGETGIVERTRTATGTVNVASNHHRLMLTALRARLEAHRVR